MLWFVVCCFALFIVYKYVFALCIIIVLYYTLLNVSKYVLPLSLPSITTKVLSTIDYTILHFHILKPSYCILYTSHFSNLQFTKPPCPPSLPHSVSISHCGRLRATHRTYCISIREYSKYPLTITSKSYIPVSGNTPPKAVCRPPLCSAPHSPPLNTLLYDLWAWEGMNEGNE